MGSKVGVYSGGRMGVDIRREGKLVVVEEVVAGAVVEVRGVGRRWVLEASLRRCDSTAYAAALQFWFYFQRIMFSCVSRRGV